MCICDLGSGAICTSLRMRNCSCERSLGAVTRGCAVNRWKPTRESDESTVYAELVVETGPAAGDIRGWTQGPPSTENRTCSRRHQRLDTGPTKYRKQDLQQETSEAGHGAHQVQKTGPAAGDIRGWTQGPPSRENRTCSRRHQRLDTGPTKYRKQDSRKKARSQDSKSNRLVPWSRAFVF